MKATITTLFAISLLIFSCNNISSENSKETVESTSIKTDHPQDHPMNEMDYLKTGKELALQTKASLAKYLVSALGENGSAGAVEFCNTKAIAITDSMSLALGAHIKRVSDQPRNPVNTANEAELAYIKKWKEAKVNGKDKAPIVTEIAGKMVGYYPIITNQMCMQCHGKPGIDINAATLKKIKQLYPADQAIGYAENEIRGIFVVDMNKQ